MGFGGISAGAGRVNITQEAMAAVAKDNQVEMSAEQLESKRAFNESLQEATNPMAARFASKQKPIKAAKGRVQKMMEMKEKGERLPVERIKDMAGQFEQRNPEMKARILALLREYIKPGDKKEDILKKVQEFYADPSLADEALDFLLETTEGELHQEVLAAKEELNQEKGREIAAGRNIGSEVREASDKGLGTTSNLRDLYRDITGTPRDSNTLFSELSQRYAFKDLSKVIKFLLHSLGSDMKAKGPSIPRGQLHALITETRALQAILGVYRFFKGRMALMEKLFQKNGLEVPQKLTFELMAKQFMSLAGERYPTADKALQLTQRLGIDKWIMAKIIALSQLRDAIREVALNQIYKSVQHRDEMYMALIEALEDLEDELEELEGREEGGEGEGEEGEEEEEQEEQKER